MHPIFLVLQYARLDILFMIQTLSILNYRSIKRLSLSLDVLNVITGSNASGKTNLYNALRLLSRSCYGNVNSALAIEGGIQSALWAGPDAEPISRNDICVEGAVRSCPVRIKLGFSTNDLGYSISFGLPAIKNSAFVLDPEIKHESIFSGCYYHPSRAILERKGHLLRYFMNNKWHVIDKNIPIFNTIFEQYVDPLNAPDVSSIKNIISSWRFYDNFRTDRESPIRQPQLGTRTLVLHHDGYDLAAAIQTIIEVGDVDSFDRFVDKAFPGCRLRVSCSDDGYFSLALTQNGLLRPLTGFELSDGSLRFILLLAALLSPRPPSLLVLNEPETSLNSELLPCLAELLSFVSETSQVIIVSHSITLIDLIKKYRCTNIVELEKVYGRTMVKGASLLDSPTWYWPD